MIATGRVVAAVGGLVALAVAACGTPVPTSAPTRGGTPPAITSAGAIPRVLPSPTPVPTPLLDTTVSDALAMLELYALDGDPDIADSNTHIAAYMSSINSGLANDIRAGVRDLVVAVDDAEAALMRASAANWATAGKNLASSAERLDLGLASLYPPTPGTTPLSVREAGVGDTRASWLRDGPPFTPGLLIDGARDAEVPATGEYNFAWTMGAECAGGGWGFELLLPPLGPINSYLATSGNVPPDAATGTRLVHLRAGDIAIHVVLGMNTGQIDTVCPWTYELIGPVGT